MNPAQHILIFGLRVYRWTVSPVLAALFSPGGACRYTPSCSQYALEAVRTHGACGGSWLAARRVCRCHPWGGHGHDPVPLAKNGTSNYGHQENHGQNVPLTALRSPETSASPVR